MFGKMKRKNVWKVLSFVLISLIWVSCSKDNSTDFEYYSDVFIVNKIVNDQTVHALAYYVYGNQKMSSATVSKVGGSGSDIELSSISSSASVMAKEPADNDFGTSQQELAGEYIFNIVTASGVSIKDSDYVAPHDLGIPVISNTSFSGQDQLEVDWDEVASAQNYVVKILDSEGQSIYVSSVLSSVLTTFTVNTIQGSWSDQPVGGETYTIQVHAFLYEENTDPSLAVYNIEEVSLGKQNIVWP